MKLILPKDRSSLTEKQDKKYQSLNNLINSLNEKELTTDFISISNSELEALNEIQDSDQHLLKLTTKTYAKIYNRAVTKLKYTTKSYYMTLWMSLGMAVFGIPFGMIFSMSLDNFAFLGLGLPIGMSIGLAIGAGLDKKAETEGRQLVV
ncbi:hypothetical protein [Ekhidna sp.]